MTEESVKNALKPILNRIYYAFHKGFNEAKRDRIWGVADNRYRSTRIWTFTTLSLENEFKAISEIITERPYNSFRFTFNGIVGRCKKLNGRKGKGLPQNIQTYRNNQFIKTQLSLLNSALYNTMELPFPIPITFGYWTDKFYEKLHSVEVVCQALNFRFEIEEPQQIIKLSDNMQHPERKIKMNVSEEAKKERKQNDKGKKNEQG